MLYYFVLGVGGGGKNAFYLLQTLHLSRPDSPAYKSLLQLGSFSNTFKYDLCHFPYRKVCCGFPPLSNKPAKRVSFLYLPGPLLLKSETLSVRNIPGAWPFKVSCPAMSAHLPATTPPLHLIFNPEKGILSLADAIRHFVVLCTRNSFLLCEVRNEQFTAAINGKCFMNICEN